MKRSEKLVSRIIRTEKLLSELKEELKIVKAAEVSSANKKEKLILTPDSLRTDFDNLYLEFIKKDLSIINDFVNSKNHYYLKQFCKANNITLDPKQMSKDKIINEILRWFMQRKAISRRI
jgi:hypothetical protein